MFNPTHDEKLVLPADSDHKKLCYQTVGRQIKEHDSEVCVSVA